jgi:hypothetical protein
MRKGPMWVAASLGWPFMSSEFTWMYCWRFGGALSGRSTKYCFTVPASLNAKGSRMLGHVWGHVSLTTKYV